MFAGLSGWSFSLLLAILILAGPGVGAKTDNLSEGTYQQLAKVHALMEREQYTQALRSLDELRLSLQHNKFETAMLLQTYAYLYTRMQRYALAITAIQDSFALKSLPRKVNHDLHYLSAQLRAGQGDYPGALADLKAWLAEEKAPQPDAHVLAGVIYAKLGDTSAALEHLELAMRLAPEPDEMQMRQLLAVYLEAGRNRDAAGLLQRIITRHGERIEDWRRLSAVYRELGDERMALAVLVLAQRKGLLQSEADLLALVKYYLYLELPHEAAGLLATSLEQNRVASSRDNWELLADAWSRSRETTRAIQALERAASFADDPQLHLKRARLAAMQEDWEQVLSAVADALRDSSLSKPGEAYLLAGIAHHYRGERISARTAFIRAEADATTRGQARQWLDSLAQNDP